MGLAWPGMPSWVRKRDHRSRRAGMLRRAGWVGGEVWQLSQPQSPWVELHGVLDFVGPNQYLVFLQILD